MPAHVKFLLLNNFYFDLLQQRNYQNKARKKFTREFHLSKPLGFEAFTVFLVCLQLFSGSGVISTHVLHSRWTPSADQHLPPDPQLLHHATSPKHHFPFNWQTWGQAPNNPTRSYIISQFLVLPPNTASV